MPSRPRNPGDPRPFGGATGSASAPALRLARLLPILSALWVCFSPGASLPAPAWAANVDPETGLAWERLLRGDLPVDLYWETFEPQMAYLRRTFGPEVSTTLDLYRQERDRPGQEEETDTAGRVLRQKTLQRWPDPVILRGENLPGLLGEPLEGLRLYACRLGRFVPIPYQFDEFTADGEKVLPDGGPEANPEAGNGLLDPQDEFLFMAHDVGDRARPEAWIDRVRDAVEITVKDPVDGGTGWCYLVRFHGAPPPPSPLNYATYAPHTNQFLSFYVFSQAAFKVIGGKLYRQVFPQRCRIPPHAGGTFENFIDRVKFRARVRLFFGSMKIQIDEDQFSGDTLAVRDGPVRCTRRSWGRIHILGFKTPKIVADIVQYDTFFANPVELSVPINPGLVLTDLTLYSGTDLTHNTYGSLWFNTHNPAGFRVDGRMSESEKRMNTAPEVWRLVTGPWGAMMNRSVWSPDYLRQATIRVEFTDDVTRGDPPEYEPGHVGMAYSYSTVRNLAPGTYVMQLDWFFPPRFPDPDRTGGLDGRTVQAYLNMYDAPVLVSTSAAGPFFPNDPTPRGASRP